MDRSVWCLAGPVRWGAAARRECAQLGDGTSRALRQLKTDWGHSETCNYVAHIYKCCALCMHASACWVPATWTRSPPGSINHRFVVKRQLLNAAPASQPA